MNTLVRLNNRPAAAYAGYPDRLDDLFAGFFRPIADSARNGVEPIRIDVSEDANAYRVAATLPGVKKDDIQVSIDQNEVTISAEVKREASAREGERVLHSERFYGKTTRVFSVSQEIDEAAVQAKYADGVLNLVLPKRAPVSAKRVTIE
ncbi:MAG: Hsp20/alpha crystallin family protein [Burkholderiales bacterium]|nr:Hsp20/alpha crystallin family protein [Burkholderiales bacterium]